MDEQGRVLAGNLEQLVSGGGRETKLGRALAADRTLQVLVADLVAARATAGMTQQDVADGMPSKSVVSRLENDVRARLKLATIEKCARAVGAIFGIRVRIRC